MAVPKRQRRRPAAQLLAEIPIEVMFDFEHGHTFPDVHPTIEDFEHSWEPVAEEFMAKWLEDNPGRRPFAWWLLEHGKERPIVNACGPDFEARERRAARFGCLHGDIWLGPHEHGGWWQQNSFLYLVGNNLLLPGERERAAQLEQSVNEMSAMSNIGWLRKTEPESRKLVTMLRDNPAVAWKHFYDLAKQYNISRPQ